MKQRTPRKDHYDGVYNELTRAELKAICSRGIKV